MVRLINSLPTPAIPAAGGPSGLLNITRLLAAQDLASGDTPASMGFTIPESSTGHGSVNIEQLPVRSVGGDDDGKSNSAKVRDRKIADTTCTPQADQDPLLKVTHGLLWCWQPGRRRVTFWCTILSMLGVVLEDPVLRRGNLFTWNFIGFPAFRAPWCFVLFVSVSFRLFSFFRVAAGIAVMGVRTSLCT